jgi:hypothetical protein
MTTGRAPLDYWPVNAVRWRVLPVLVTDPAGSTVIQDCLYEAWIDGFAWLPVYGPTADDAVSRLLTKYGPDPGTKEGNSWMPKSGRWLPRWRRTKRTG